MNSIFKPVVFAAVCLCSTAAVQAEYFIDDFSWGFNSSLWTARSGDNARAYYDFIEYIPY